MSHESLGVTQDMTEHLISVKDFATQNGLLRQTVFKVLRRLEVEPSKARGGDQNRGQTISYITEDDARRVLEALASRGTASNGQQGEEPEFTDAVLYDIGIFYLLCLEPDHDPSRIKVGFASNLNERLRQLRCSAPYAKVVRTWQCRRLWERTAIECVTEGCERLHTEVFRAQSIDAVEARCEQFFALMPQLAGRQST